MATSPLWRTSGSGLSKLVSIGDTNKLGCERRKGSSSSEQCSIRVKSSSHRPAPASNQSLDGGHSYKWITRLHPQRENRNRCNIPGISENPKGSLKRVKCWGHYLRQFLHFSRHRMWLCPFYSGGGYSSQLDHGADDSQRRSRHWNIDRLHVV